MNEAATFATGENVQVPNVGMSSSPSGVVFKDTLYVLHQGSKDNGQINYVTSTDGGKTWSTDQRISNFGMSASPSGVVFKNALYVFHQGSKDSGALWYTTTTNGVTWNADRQIANVGLTDSPSAVVFKDKLYVFHQGSKWNGACYYSTTVDGTTWAPDVKVPNVGMSSSPSAVVFKDKLYVFHQGHKDSVDLWFTTSSDGTSWSADSKVNGARMASSPSAIVFGSQFYVFHRGSGNSDQVWYITSSNGTNWSADQLISGPGMSVSPSAVESMGQICVFYQGRGKNSQLWKYIHDSMEIVGVDYDLSIPPTKVKDKTVVTLYTQTVTNNTDTEQPNSVSMTASTAETSYFENSTSNTVSMEVGREFSAKIPVVEAEVGGSLKLGLSHTKTNMYGQSSTISKEYQATVNVITPPKTKITVTFSVSKCILDVPYTMRLRSKDGHETTCQGIWQGLTSWHLDTHYSVPVPL